MGNHQKTMKKKQRVVEIINEDYISTLPNSILGNILSSLKIKEAVKTSVLSSKWRYIYKNPTNLILNADNILVKDYSSHTNIYNLSKVLQFDIKMKRAYTFLTNVNQYLSLVKDVQKIDKLKVCFTFCHKGYGSNDLDEWIQFAVERNADEIDLCLLEKNQLSAPSDGSFYVFPCDVFGFKSNLKCLRLSHCVLAPHKLCNFGFSTPTTIELFKVDLKSEEHIQNLLSSCDNIEWLSFSECYNVNSLKIEHPFCKKLKYLKVNLCQQLKAIMLQSNSLETLEYEGCKIDFFFDTPKLKSFYGRVSKSTASYEESWPAFKLSTDLPQLETLFLECVCRGPWQNTFSGVSPLSYAFFHPQDLNLRPYLIYLNPVSPIKGEIITKKLPRFPNLRHLEIIKVAISRQDLSWLPVTLKACPTLSILKLHLRTSFHDEEELWNTSGPPTRYPHDHLKEVTITGIRGHSSEIAIAIYLLKNAIALEKMVVDPRPRIYLGNGKCGYSEEASENWSKVERKKVCMLLKQEVGSLVELLIL